MAVPAAKAWDALRDVGNVHTRVAPGFVRECRLDGEARDLTFGNGLQVRELIVDLDEQARRLAYSARGGHLEHHSASFQVFETGPGACRIVWLADVLPHEAAQQVGAMMEAGSQVMKRTLEAA